MDWRKERSRNGGADEVPLPEGVAGRLWLCGKHFIGPDADLAFAKTGATTAVCLSESAELADRYPDYVAWLRDNQPERAVWFPVPDLHAPSHDAAASFLDGLVARLHRGEVLLVHCGAGIGRAGTMAAAVLMRLGASVEDAIEIVSASRPMAGPEAGAQLEFLESLG